MDDIKKLEMNLVPYRQRSIMMALTIESLTNSMIKKVELEYKKDKNPELSNAELRRIAVQEKLQLDSEYTEAVTEKMMADEAIMYGEINLNAMKREFIIKYLQNIKLPV
ncbi:MAG: hypothetical protein PHN69_04600 [Candidatus Pacebacteria bacterium]|nr:hypothetical protein [Fermentimonas sp.]MDD4804434.1 hypothetical protein [Candidatus Paceibacterota bacterium]